MNQASLWRMLSAVCVALILACVALGAATPAAFADDGDTAQPATEAQEAPQATESQPAAEAAPANNAESASSSSSAAQGAADTNADKPAKGPATKLDVEGITIGKDVFVGTRNLSSKEMQVAANLFASAQSLTLDGAEVGADAFMAGQSVNLSDTTVGNNLFVAGANATLARVNGANIFVSGNNLDLDANAKNLRAAGRTIFLKGTYEGDVEVFASNVVVDPYVVVKGTLNVTADQEPTIASTTKIGSYNYNQTERGNSSLPLAFAVIGTTAWLWGLLMMFLGMLALGAVMLLLMRTEVIDSAGALVRERPLAVFVSGLITILVLPLLTVALFATGVCWTIALALTFAMVIITVFAGTFTAISVGRAVLGRINKWVSSVIFIIVFALLFSLPIVDFVVGAICTLYFTGSIIQGWWVWRRADRDDDSYNGRPGNEPDYSEFAVPRGTHVNPPVTEQAVAPIPATQNIPTRNSAEYRPSDLS